MKRATNSRSSSISSADFSRARKRFRSTSTDKNTPGIKVFIVQAKLDNHALQQLFDLLEEIHKHPTRSLSLALCTNVEDSDLIITNVKMRKRFERHVDWNIAKQKAIVTPDWLRESVKAKKLLDCGLYAALPQLHNETARNCLDVEPTTLETDLTSHSPFDPPGPTIQPTSPEVFANWASRYACTRASPLVCINHELALELNILCQSRELEGLAINALSYERCVAIIKSYPYPITLETYQRDIAKLPGLGDKTRSKVKEFIKYGYIKESRMYSHVVRSDEDLNLLAEEIRSSERFQSLSLFASIYGIGPSNARKLYDIGLRTMDDLHAYYDVPAGSTVSDLEADLVTSNGKKIPKLGKLPDLSIKVALALQEDFAIPIPPNEVEEIRSTVLKALEHIQPGCVSTIVGGYRRGKRDSSDVDIVISHRDLRRGANLVKGLCTKLTQRLYDCGMLTHLMHLSGFHSHNALRAEHWDSLEKALTVLILPPDGERKRIHRRVDLIFAVPEAYWTAVVGWSGSKMFQRDLRLWAKVEKGMKFDSSGMTRRHDSKLYAPKNELEVFELLGLKWIDPTMRNADI